jgi:hypothetical protein
LAGALVHEEIVGCVPVSIVLWNPRLNNRFIHPAASVRLYSSTRHEK